MIDGITLDQLRVFIAVVDTGSFTAAGKRLARTQSAMSEAIANLEARFAIALFDRSAQKPVLTDAGRSLLADARAALATIDRLKARARGLNAGLEAELRVVISVLVPVARLVPVLVAFEAEYPTVSLRLSVDEIGVAIERVIDGTADIGMTGEPGLAGINQEQIVRYAIGAVETVAVAAPSHPLAQSRTSISEEDLRAHRQLLPTARGAMMHRHALGRDQWRVADLTARREMLRAGLGWGTMPGHAVDGDLLTGRLVRLELRSRSSVSLTEPLVAIHRPDRPLGPAAQWLINRLASGQW
ncbi:MAG: LysR family transcriptional regulator [Sphingorhabdus sp.]